VSSLALLVAACSGSEAPNGKGAAGTAGATPLAGQGGSSGSGGAGTAGVGSAGSVGASGGTSGASASGAAGMPAGAGAGSSGSGGLSAGSSGSSGTPGLGGMAGLATAGTTALAGTSGDGGDPGGAPSSTPVEEGIALLPADRQEHGVVAAHGEVFVLGGYSPDVTPSVIAYDPAQDMWRDVADFPSPFNHPAAGVVDDKIYVAGYYAGTSLTGPATGRTYVYDPVADEWSEKKALPTGTERAGGCVTALGTDLYVFGGGNSGDATDFASVYDTVGDSWTELPKLPETREHCSAYAKGGKIYIVGGRTHTIPEFRPSTLEFDPTAKTYTPKTPIPTPRGGAAGAVLGGRIFLFGGEGAGEDDGLNGVFPDIEAYDGATDTWEAFPPMLIPRHGYGGATLGDRIYLAGGAIRQGGGASDIATVFYFP